MALYHTIQEKLVQLNEASFENLCNDFFPQWRIEYKNFHSNTVIGKVKTRKGKPDSYAILADGSFVLFEYTTSNERGLYNKLKKDLIDCLKLTTTKFKHCKINRVILCFNGRLLDPSQSNELREIARGKKQFVELIALDQLCNELQKYSPLLVNHLNIELPYSQFLTTSEFVKQSVHRKFSTPLTNPFVGREKEIEEINQFLENEDIVFISGKSGVGKTRISLEVIDRRIKSEKNIEAFCVKYKGSTKLREELLNVWDRNKNLLLLIDDANYVKAGLLPIASLQEEAGKGKIKVLLTVRDYVFTETVSSIKDFKYSLAKIPTLSNKEIEEVLKNPPYKLHFTVIDRIDRLAKDNTRLAMMLAEIVSEERKWSAFENTTQVYHKYFEEHLKETLLKDDDSKKVIALLWLFQGLDITDSALYTKIEKAFGLNAKRVWEVIGQLSEQEIVDVYAESIAKIPEQTIGGYLFYYVFFHKRLLSLETLFAIFYESHRTNIFSKVRDSIETFDYEKVKEILEPVLLKTWERIKDDDLRCEEFLNEYWFVFPTKVLTYCKKKIDLIPVPSHCVYKADYKNSSYYPEDRILKLLRHFLRQITNEYETTLELILEYARRKPEFTGELTKFFIDWIGYDFDDERYRFYRQNTLLKALSKGIKIGNVFEAIWFTVALKFLNTEFQHANSKQKHAISLYRYSPKLDKTISAIRKNVFNTLIKLYKKQPEKSFSFFESYVQQRGSITKEAYKHDVTFIKTIVETKLNPKDIAHSYLVEDVYRYFKQEKIYDFSKEREPFYSSKFKTLQVFDVRRLDGVEEYLVSRRKTENYDELKKEEIRKKIEIKSINHFEDFYNILEEGLSKGVIQSYFLSDCLHTVMGEVRKKNFPLFRECLHFIAQRNNTLGFYLRLNFEETEIGKKEFDSLYETLKTVTFSSSEDWISWLFFFAPQSFLTQEHLEHYLQYFKEGKRFFSVRSPLLQKFEIIKAGFVKQAIQEFVRTYEEYKNPLSFDTDFTKEFIHHFLNDLDTFVKFYFIREEIYKRYDYDGEDFLIITKQLPSFPIQYLEWTSKNHQTHFDEERHELDFLKRLWSLPESEPIIEKVLDFILSKRGLWLVGAYPVNSIFNSHPSHTSDFKIRVENFLVGYVKKNFKSVERMNAVINICHHTLQELYPKIIKTFLSKTKSIKDFKKLKWQKQYGVVSGGVIWGELYGNDWKELLTIIKSFKPKSNFIEHIDYIEQEIAWCNRLAEDERKDRFVDDWYN